MNKMPKITKLLFALLSAGLLNCSGEPPKGVSMIELPDVFHEGFNGTLAESELKNQAARFRRLHQLPFTKEEWKPDELRAKIWKALGVTVDHSVPLDLQITKTIPDRKSVV